MESTEATVRQSGVIPYRIANGVVEILLITNSSGTAWLVPKGHIEADLSPQESAVKEAYEEAGIVGVIAMQPVGVFEYVKRATRRVVEVFPMSVAAVLPTWPEMTRKRTWAGIDEAARIVGYPQLDRCILNLRDRIDAARAAA